MKNSNEENKTPEDKLFVRRKLGNRLGSALEYGNKHYTDETAHTGYPSRDDGTISRDDGTMVFDLDGVGGIGSGAGSGGTGETVSTVDGVALTTPPLPKPASTTTSNITTHAIDGALERMMERKKAAGIIPSPPSSRPSPPGSSPRGEISSPRVRRLLAIDPSKGHP